MFLGFRQTTLAIDIAEGSGDTFAGRIPPAGHNFRQRDLRQRPYTGE